MPETDGVTQQVSHYGGQSFMLMRNQYIRREKEAARFIFERRCNLIVLEIMYILISQWLLVRSPVRKRHWQY